MIEWGSGDHAEEVPAGPGLRAVWWFAVPLVSLGFLTPAIALYAAIRLRDRVTAMAAVGYAVLEAVFLLDPRGGGDHALALGFALINWLVASLHMAQMTERYRLDYRYAALRRYVDAAESDDDDVAEAQRRRDRRIDARQIVDTDLALAVDLRIGRPDLDGDYDDGGLIDANHVPTEWLVSELGMLPSVAAEVDQLRRARDGFDSVDDMFMACPSLNPARIEILRDRLVFIPRDREPRALP